MDGQCECGRGLPLMESVDGRISQFVSIIDSETGKIIPVLAAGPGIIAKAMDLVPVSNYRVIQNDVNSVTILVVPKPTYDESHTQFVKNFLYPYLGRYIDVRVELVNDVPPLPSGKRSVVISKVNAFS
jgi:phenylacetate-CoA ligase